MATQTRSNRLSTLGALLCAGATAFAAPVQAGDSVQFGEPLLYGGTNDFTAAAADFDHDGDIDLLTADRPERDGFGFLISPGRYAFNENDGSGQPSGFNRTVIDSQHGAYALAVGDLDGDGNLDIASANTAGTLDNMINVLFGNGDGSFGPVVALGDSVLDGVQAIALGDMDNDGDLDIVLPNGEHILVNDGSGNFTQNFVGGSVASGDSIALGDVNEDGHLDVVTVDDTYSTNRVSVVLQLGTGNGNGDPGPPQPVNIGGASPYRVALSDVDNDGHLDLLSLNQATDDVSVLLGAGDGTFATPMTFPAYPSGSFSPSVFTVADLNNDGAPEITITSRVYGNATSHEETAILLNDGNGSYTTAQVIEEFGQYEENIVAADFDGDGDVDLATATHLLFNMTDPIASADLNADGVVDVFDLFDLLNAWGSCAGCPEDLNGDGVVDVFDLFELLNAFSP